MKIEQIKLADLTPYANNSRTHTVEQVAQVAASIKEFGFTNPVLIDKDGGIIAGHGRVLAAKQLGLDDVPCIRLGHLTAIQKRAYIIADNKLAENSGWDDELLALEIEELQQLDFDLELLGFDDKELLEIIPAEIMQGLTDDDAVPQVSEVATSALGDLWNCGNHRVMCGSSINIDDVKKLTDGIDINLVFTDPPYGIDVVSGGGPTKFGKIGGGGIVDSGTYSKIIGDDTVDVAKDFYFLCVELGFNNFVLWGGNYFTEFLDPSRCWYIWNKKMTGNFSQAEMAWTSFTVGGVKIFDFLWNGLSREGNRKDELKKRVHPTQKPVGLFVSILSGIDNINSIFDGFLGSGTTMIAAEKTGRLCYGMELDPRYVDVIVNRWQDFTGKQATLESDGRTFAEHSGAART